MKNIIVLLLVLFGSSCTSTKKIKTQKETLDGTWSPVKQEMNGKLFPREIYNNQRLTISDSLYTVSAESVDKGIVKYHNGKMDIYGKDGVNAGKHFTAIYKLENNTLTICYNLSGTAYPETFDTKGKQPYFLMEFKKN